MNICYLVRHLWCAVAALLISSSYGEEITAKSPSGPRSIRDFGVLPSNHPATNRVNLQTAIDWATTVGAALWVEPSDEPYPIESGIRVRMNVSIIGAQGPTGRGTRHPSKSQPVGSVFRIEDDQHPFITVEGATQVRGIQFWYPKQTLRDPDKIIPYPPTIQVAKDKSAQGVTLSCLTFYGEYIAMDFNSHQAHPCEQILFEHCYGYPLSGEFIRIDYCYDIPRILHCHVNPANQRYFAGGFSRRIIDSVVARKNFTYTINHTDNAQMIDVFTFGAYGGILLGAATYGQLSNFNLDCVTIGIEKRGDSTFNRNWQIAQGSIIANVGTSVDEIHPFIISGQGHTAIANVESFSGGNPALTTLGKSFDFMTVVGENALTVSMVGCRMRNYEAKAPITCRNSRATIQASACVDKDERPYPASVQ